MGGIVQPLSAMLLTKNAERNYLVWSRGKRQLDLTVMCLKKLGFIDSPERWVKMRQSIPGTRLTSPRFVLMRRLGPVSYLMTTNLGRGSRTSVFHQYYRTLADTDSLTHISFSDKFEHWLGIRVEPIERV